MIISLSGEMSWGEGDLFTSFNEYKLRRKCVYLTRKMCNKHENNLVFCQLNF